jgi:beta-glucanase (GH16 family)
MLASLATTAASVMLLGLAHKAAAKVNPAQFDTLVFSDEFDEFDFTKWKHEITLGGGGNWEFQMYANNRSNSYVDDGALYMRPTFTADAIGEQAVQINGEINLWGSSPADMCTGNAFYGCQRAAGGGGNPLNPITSSRLRTAETFTFKYGRVEINAKLPKGDWLWPALWMLPVHNAYGQWPASGEIDIMESRGNARGTFIQPGVEAIGSTLHWGPMFTENRFQLTSQEYTLQNTDFSEDFHVFGLVWTEDELYTYVDTDDNRVLQVDFTDQSMWERGGWANSTYDNVWMGRGNNAPFDQEYYLVMNVAVGGTTGYFADGGNKPWSNNSPTSVKQFYDARGQWESTWNHTAVNGRKGPQNAMAIDYVRVWQ